MKRDGQHLMVVGEIAMTKLHQSTSNASVDVLQSYFPDVIAKMPSRFTFHDFARLLAHQHQREYIDSLADYKHKDAPFQALHRELEQRLESGKYGIRLVEPKKVSTDIFGNHSHCGEWEKVS